MIRWARSSAFTLIELMVGFVVLAMILGLVLSMTSEALKIWRGSIQKKDAFAEGRAAFESLTRTVSQATLNIYWAYRKNAAGSIVGYGRESELHFLCGRTSGILTPSGGIYPGSAIFFHAPLGDTRNMNYERLRGALNSIGYYVQHGPDPDTDPLTGVSLLRNANKSGYRLMQWIAPTETLGVYQLTSGNPATAGNPTSFSRSWITPTPDSARMMANHVLGLFIAARYTDSTGKSTPVFEYDSRNPALPAEMRHQLPTSIKIAMIVIDEMSAVRLGGQTVAVPDAIYDSPDTMDTSLEAFVDGLATPQGNRPALNARIFTMEISLAGTRWSES